MAWALKRIGISLPLVRIDGSIDIPATVSRDVAEQRADTRTAARVYGAG